MIGKFLLVLGSSIFLLLGVAHMYYTFFTDKFSARNPSVTDGMKQTSPVLTRDTTMWNAWVGFNASHSLGAILFGIIYFLLALRHEDVLIKSPIFMLVAIAVCFFYGFLGIRYWFKIPLTGIALATICFCISAVMLYW